MNKLLIILLILVCNIASGQRQKPDTLIINQYRSTALNDVARINLKDINKPRPFWEVVGRVGTVVGFSTGLALIDETVFPNLKTEKARDYWHYIGQPLLLAGACLLLNEIYDYQAVLGLIGLKIFMFDDFMYYGFYDGWTKGWNGDARNKFGHLRWGIPIRNKQDFYMSAGLGFGFNIALQIPRL